MVLILINLDYLAVRYKEKNSSQFGIRVFEKSVPKC